MYLLEFPYYYQKRGSILKSTADTGDVKYNRNRLNSFRPMKRLECNSFINYAVIRMKNGYSTF